MIPAKRDRANPARYQDVSALETSSASFSDFTKRLQTPRIFGRGLVPTENVEVAVVSADFEEQIVGAIPLVDDFFNTPRSRYS
jgi:hypothetical protein